MYAFDFIIRKFIGREMKMSVTHIVYSINLQIINPEYHLNVSSSLCGFLPILIVSPFFISPLRITSHIPSSI